MIRGVVCLLAGLSVGLGALVLYGGFAWSLLCVLAAYYPPLGELGWPQDSVFFGGILCLCGAPFAWSAGLLFGASMADRYFTRETNHVDFNGEMRGGLNEQRPAEG